MTIEVAGALKHWLRVNRAFGVTFSPQNPPRTLSPKERLKRKRLRKISSASRRRNRRTAE